MPPKTTSAAKLQQLALLRSDPRVAQFVEDALVLRTPTRKIVELLKDRYDVSPDLGKRFIRNVLRQWEIQQQKQASTRKAHMRATLDAFYQQAMKDRKYAAALQALHELIKLDGLAEPDRLRIDVGTMSVEAAVSHIEEAHEMISLAKSRGVIEATATVVPPDDTGSTGGGDTH